MVVGETTANRELQVSVQVRDNLGLMHDVPALLDTGFAGGLTLPPLVTETLEMEPAEIGTVLLADGSQLQVFIYSVTIVWDGQEQNIDAYGMGSFPFVGMKLLYGMVGTIHFSDGGPLVLFRP